MLHSDALRLGLQFARFDRLHDAPTGFFEVSASMPACTPSTIAMARISEKDAKNRETLSGVRATSFAAAGPIADKQQPQGQIELVRHVS